MAITFELRGIEPGSKVTFLEFDRTDDITIREGHLDAEKIEPTKALETITALVKEPFEKIIGFAEDTIFNVQPSGVFFVLSVFDAFSGKHHAGIVNRDALTAILCLCYGGDDGSDVDAHYALAEPALATFPNECRIIP